MMDNNSTSRTLEQVLQIVAETEFPINDLDLLSDIIAAASDRTIDAWAIGMGDAGEQELVIYWPDGSMDHLSAIHEWPDRSLDAVVKLMPEDWWWTLGLCSLSGDASIGPDYNGLAHERLLVGFPPEIFDGAFNEDLRPGDGIHRACQAMLVCILTARKMMQERQA